ncbi:hypothetical protein HU200_005402 [Digitaria exilis]|uniref:Uncharacterized protein n=1 Tax=Digitaria exilis TaxID=1010633 RepID=A0A835FR28_9POAL|nr:hypothetical protein HU200_005402 [Digitaria exilis]
MGSSTIHYKVVRQQATPALLPLMSWFVVGWLRTCFPRQLSPPALYYATGRKQSNGYRSAYEAGKVVIEALQKYSLLPAYSVFVPTPTSSTGSLTATPSASNSQDEVTGVSKLAEGVPQLEQDELVDRHESGQLKWVSFMNDDGRASIEEIPHNLPNARKLKMLLLLNVPNSIMPMMKLQPRQRHVELSAKNQYPHGLKHLLSVTNSMLVTDDAFVRYTASFLSQESTNLYQAQSYIFQIDHSEAPSPLPGIVKIYLQELPQLQRIHDDVMFQFEAPKWEKLFVRGCPSFHHLPLLKKEYRKSKVQVSGERDWWGKLKWSLPEQSDCYLHVPPPEFAWRKKYIIRSYLR